jgi:Na+/melibiose symporter-like transporter
MANFFTNSKKAALAQVSGHSRKDAYGKQRMWGSFGVTFSTIAIGKLTDLYGYNSMFYTCALSSAVFAVMVSVFFPSHTQEVEAEKLKQAQAQCAPSDAVPTKRASSSRKQRLSELDPDEITSSFELPPSPTASDSNTPLTTHHKRHPNIMTLLGNPQYAFFLLVVFLIGLSKHVLSILSVQFISLKFGTNNFIVGLTQATTVLPEVLLFYFGHYMVQSMGIHWLMVFAQIATVTRCLVLGWIPPSYLFLVYFVESLKGVSTACLTLASVQLSHELAPPGLEAVAQGAMVSVLHVSPA